jgi:hypothetical protein
MLYRILADGVLLLHIGFILFVVFGALLVARRRGLMPAHLLAAVWGFGIEASGAVCPLTYVENALRNAAGESGCSGGFIEHYLLSLVYPPGLGRASQFVLAGAVLAVNAGLYAWILRRRRAG